MRVLATDPARRGSQPRWMAAPRQRGVSLVELMIGMALGLVLLTGVTSVAIRINAASSHSMKMSRLHQQMRSTMDFMVKDLQRAGFVNWHAALDNCSSYESEVLNIFWTAGDFYECVTPVMSAMGQIWPASLYDEDSDCILYSYDLDGDGGRSTADFELFGFKLAAGAVRTRTAGDTHACDSGTWQALSDAEMVVSKLLFRVDVHPSGAPQAAAYQLSYDVDEPYPGWHSGGSVDDCAAGGGHLLDDKCVWRRTLTIELAGHLAGEPDVAMSLISKVTLRNDQFQRESPF